MIGLALGALQFGTQALGAIGGFNSQNAAAAAQNRQAMKIYQQQLLMDHYKKVQAYDAFNKRKTRYANQVYNNQTAAQRAYFSEQQRQNEILKQAGFADQARMIGEQKALGKLAASGQQGRSAARNMALTSAAFGRAGAVQQEKLRTGVSMMNERNRETRRKLQIANETAYLNVGAIPTFGPGRIAPMQQEGPSSLGLVAQLGGAALSGFDAYNKYKNYDPSI